MMRKLNLILLMLVVVLPAGAVLFTHPPGSGGSPPFYAEAFGARPNDGVCDVVALQNAIDAAELVGGAVWLEAGVYDLNPNNAVYPTFTSEAFVNTLLIRSNNFKMYGTGAFGTTLRLMNARTAVAKVNIIGSGGFVDPGDPYTYGCTNIILSGFGVDANGYAAECLQIYFASNFVCDDILATKTTTGNDGFDFQQGINNALVNCVAIDIYDNAIGVQEVNFVTRGFLALRCGIRGGTGVAFQFNAGGARLYDVTALECNELVDGTGSLDNCFLSSTNLSGTNIIVATGETLILKNTTLFAPLVSAGAQILVSGGTLVFDHSTLDNFKPGIRMTSGNLTVKGGSTLGGSAGERPLQISGATSVVLEDSYFNAGTSQRDVRLETGTINNAIIRNNRFLGDVGFYFDSSASTGLQFINNYSKGAGYFAVSGDLENNWFNAGMIVAAGTPVFKGNTIASTYTRNGGTPVFKGGNVFTASANVAEVQESLPAFNTVSVTASQTLYTNTNPFDVQVFFRGGTIDGVGKNGTQIYGVSTTGNSVRLGFGEWVGITNSVTAGEVINWTQQR